MCPYCNATLVLDPEEKEYVDSDVDSLNEIYSWNDRWEDDGSFFFENPEDAGRDGDEHDDFWAVMDEDEDESQDLDQYEADLGDQDTDMDRDDEDHQFTNPSEDQHNTSNLQSNTEDSQESPLSEDNPHNQTPTSLHVSIPDPSPTPEPHHETIALGQHHLWMM